MNPCYPFLRVIVVVAVRSGAVHNRCEVCGLSSTCRVRRWCEKKNIAVSPWGFGSSVASSFQKRRVKAMPG